MRAFSDRESPVCKEALSKDRFEGTLNNAVMRCRQGDCQDILERVRSIKTREQARQYLAEVQKKVRAYRPAARQQP